MNFALLVQAVATNHASTQSLLYLRVANCSMGSRLLHLGDNGEKTELIGGAPAGLWRNHPPGYGAVIECINPTISASYAGELRKRGGEWGLWPIHIQDVLGGETRIIKESDLLLTEMTGRERRRSVIPLYRSKPITATPYLALLPLVTQ